MSIQQAKSNLYFVLSDFEASRAEGERKKNPQAAEEAFQAARNVVERIKGSVKHPTLRASLESAPMIRRIYELSPK